ncbi:MAG: DUF4367 domain-containing protein [Ruminococcaceae bacterium]|nr:DUF4367 domain-containing protein [Oscillospiraceae bacterium]
MNNKILSEESIVEDYENLVFEKVFAIYCAEESKEIFDEIRKREKQETKGKQIVEKLFNKKERKENFRTLGNIFKKGFLFAASFVLVAIISVSSVVVASADIREVVTDIIYHLVFEENERYTKISAGEANGFIDPELYDWEGAYAPTYMPEGFEFVERTDFKDKHDISYSDSKNTVVISQFINSSYNIDTEGALDIIHTNINNSEAIIVSKEDKNIVSWSSGQTMVWIRGNVNVDELIKIAKSMKMVE